MAIIVEDGTLIANANSYVSSAYAATYFSDRGIDAWASLANTDALLIRGQEYMFNVYHLLWSGYRYKNTQALDWPRVWVPIEDLATGFGPYPSFVDIALIPDQVKKAQCELALKFGQQGDLLYDVVPTVLSEKVGSIQITYDPNSSGVTIYRSINAMLSALLQTPSMANASLVR